MNCIMKKKDHVLATFLIDFLIDKYYLICKKQHVDTEIMIESILAVMHTSILALEGSQGNHDTLVKIYSLIKFHINKFGV